MMKTKAQGRKAERVKEREREVIGRGEEGEKEGDILGEGETQTEVDLCVTVRDREGK